MRTLRLTSPYLRGADVTRLQKALIKHGYLKDKADGVYGPLTAQAVYRAKYWLGYAKPDQAAAAQLLAFLEGKKATTAAMKKVAAARKKQAAQVPMRVKALKWLEQRIGNKESPPNSNRVVWASEWYGLIGPWCAMACTRAYVESGSKAFARGRTYAYVPYIVSDAGAGRNNLALTKDPQSGDLVCFDWNGDGVSDHVGLFVKWTNTKRTSFESVEGNTSSDAHGSQSNGGEVCRKTRQRSLVQAFVHCGK